eukprot:PITA_04027
MQYLTRTIGGPQQNFHHLKGPTSSKGERCQNFPRLGGVLPEIHKDFNKLASPLVSLLGKDVEFIWSENCQEALDTLKRKLVTAPILRGPNCALPFHIHTDASNKAIGTSLGQIDENLPYSIYFIRKNLSKVELCHTVTKKELLVVVHYLKEFRHHITGYQTFVHIDHVAIRYLMNKTYVNSRIIRWFLLLQQFDLTIMNKSGKENVVVDFLSRVNFPAGEEIMVDDQMPDEHLFAISVLSPWFVDIENYLVAAQFPPHISSKDKSKIVRKSAPFTWIRGNLFKLGPDQILRRCVREEEVFEILLTCHDGPCAGNFVAKRTTFKILQAGYFWPTLHQDVRRHTSQMQALLHTKVVQLQRKIWHDKNIKEKQLQEGDWALLDDSRYKDFKGKLRTRWLGPYTVEKCNDNGSILIRTIDDEAIPMLVNGH